MIIKDDGANLRGAQGGPLGSVGSDRPLAALGVTPKITLHILFSQKLC